MASALTVPMHSLRRSVFAWSLAWLLAGVVHAQITLNGDAVVYFGSAANTSAPASIDETKVKEATTEWQTIQAEGVRPGSARYRLLAAEMDKRIREAVKTVASGASKDLVVRSGDVANAQGKEIVDLTDKVIAKL